MPEGRPAIPRTLQRELLVEAGHRCAIPTCRQPTALQYEHIEDWAKVREHRFASMIVLCANCHARKTAGDIDRLSLHRYKANLAVLNSRYGEFERRVLTLFAQDPTATTIQLSGGFDIFLMYLINDGLLVKLPPPMPNVQINGVYQSEQYGLTNAGRALVARWAGARLIDESAVDEDAAGDDQA